VPEIFHELEAPGTELAYDQAGADRGNQDKVGKPVSAYDADARAVIAHLLTNPHCSGKLGSVGICIGGHLSFRAAMNPEVLAGACFYATDIHKGSLGKGGDDSLARAGDIKGEILMIWGRQDPHIPAEGRSRIWQRLTDAGVHFTWHGCDPRDVARPAARGDVGPSDGHPRAGDDSFLDRVAQSHVHENAPRAHVAHGGEAGEERDPRVAGADVGLPRRGAFQRGRGARRLHFVHQVRMAVDEAGQDGEAREIDEARPRRGRLRGGQDFLDALAADEHQPIAQDRSALHIDESARTQRDEVVRLGRNERGRQDRRHSKHRAPHEDSSTVKARRRKWSGELETHRLGETTALNPDMTVGLGRRVAHPHDVPLELAPVAHGKQQLHPYADLAVGEQAGAVPAQRHDAGLLLDVDPFDAHPHRHGDGDRDARALAQVGIAVGLLARDHPFHEALDAVDVLLREVQEANAHPDPVLDVLHFRAGGDARLCGGEEEGDGDRLASWKRGPRRVDEHSACADVARFAADGSRAALASDLAQERDTLMAPLVAAGIVWVAGRRFVVHLSLAEEIPAASLVGES